MKLFARLALTGLLLAGATAARAEPVSALSAADPKVFVEQLGAMGFAVDPVVSGETPTSSIKVGESDYVLAFGGCTAGKDCRYVVLLGKYSDVTNPPAAWIAKENADFDYIKVWVADDGQLTFSTGLIVEGMAADTFRASVQMFVDSAADLAKDAIDAGLTKRQAA